MTIHIDKAFAPLDHSDDLERIAGGNETEVYRTDDRRYVVKLKDELAGTPEDALAHAQLMRAFAERYSRLLGSRHTIPSYYAIVRDSRGLAQVLVIQPYLRHARTLYMLHYEQLDRHTRDLIAHELYSLIRLSRHHYDIAGSMPDLYGRTSSSSSERKRLNRPWMLPYRLWSFLVKRNLLRAHNLMFVEEPEPRVVLVDYDFVRRGPLYRLVYFTVRRLLFWRDMILIEMMRFTGRAP